MSNSPAPHMWGTAGLERASCAQPCLPPARASSAFQVFPYLCSLITPAPRIWIVLKIPWKWHSQFVYSLFHPQREAGYSSQKISPTLSQQIIVQRVCQGCKRTWCVRVLYLFIGKVTISFLVQLMQMVLKAKGFEGFDSRQNQDTRTAF